MDILVTGAAGFIGSAITRKLLDRGDSVLAVDNLSPYYDVQLKRDRLSLLSGHSEFKFLEMDVAHQSEFHQAYREFSPHVVVHLAAQPGVRYSIEHPEEYIHSNIGGFFSVLETCRQEKCRHLVFASSSSVYGANTKMPYSVHQGTEHPLSLYAATKKSNEMMAHSYAHLYRLPCTGLRFFTVYGPWGRPDMAAFTFARKILAGEPIEVFNEGHHHRDFTYIDDVTEALTRIVDRPPVTNPLWSGEFPDPGTSLAPYKIYNIGNHSPVLLSDFITILEKLLGRKAVRQLKGLQPGDVPDTYADVEDLQLDFEFKPNTPLEEGLASFVAWYQKYFKIS
ncbi:MAG: NAD-dependent epimerase/dehydratase family protein [Bdellovibrionaceae bacterium]|nr:NAD-dependent epimerase/dehydratase family protein [Bdellovibrionales bacterium]MCB9084632.1 NAD-dependent epimerase/dehydratase family protein [Pseudobdellovibrionaceae bacterium]